MKRNENNNTTTHTAKIFTHNWKIHVIEVYKMYRSFFKRSRCNKRKNTGSTCARRERKYEVVERKDLYTTTENSKTNDLFN